MSAGRELDLRGTPGSDAGWLTPAISGSAGGAIMPMVPAEDAEARWIESGRIRMGDSEELPPKRAGGRPGKRPRKLDRFRLTSPFEDLIEIAAEKYGGNVEPWPDAPDGPQWQVYVTETTLPIIIPPAMAATQQWETWDKPEGTTGRDRERAPLVAVRKCTGRRMIPGGEPCRCELAIAAGDAAERLCKKMTRLNVLLHELPDFGMWRLQTAGTIAGNQLATFMLFMFPGLPPWSKLLVGIRPTSIVRQTTPGRFQKVSIPIPILRTDPAAGLSPGDLLGHRTTAPPAAVATVVARAAAASGERDNPAAVVDAPPSEDDREPGPTDPDDGEGDDWYRSAASEQASTGSPSRSDRADPSRTRRGRAMRNPGDLPPVLSWCNARGLDESIAGRYLVREDPSAFGDGGTNPLRSVEDLAALPGNADDPDSAAGHAIELLSRHFTRLGEPVDWAGET